jgi:ribonuclease BN (tRNA processing enzyme)
VADGGTANVLLDLGQGAYSNLAATIEPSEIAAVFVSHLHPDHFVDLVPLRHYLKWEFEPSRSVRVIAPKGLTARLDGLNGHDGFAADGLDIETLTEGTLDIGPFRAEIRRISHTADSYAFRIGPADDSPGLVYSGDCAKADELGALIRRGDTLLSEASFGADPVAVGAQHIAAQDAARVAAAHGASRLLLTHVLAGHSRSLAQAVAREHFSGPVSLVVEGDCFEI